MWPSAPNDFGERMAFCDESGHFSRRSRHTAPALDDRTAQTHGLPAGQTGAGAYLIAAAPPPGHRGGRDPPLPPGGHHRLLRRRQRLGDAPALLLRGHPFGHRRRGESLSGLFGAGGFFGHQRRLRLRLRFDRLLSPPPPAPGRGDPPPPSGGGAAGIRPGAHRPGGTCAGLCGKTGLGSGVHRPGEHRHLPALPLRPRPGAGRNPSTSARTCFRNCCGRNVPSTARFPPDIGGIWGSAAVTSRRWRMHWKAE